jgi:hypothetical protein
MKTGWLTTRFWFGMAAYRFAHVVSEMTLVWNGGLLVGSRWWTKRFLVGISAYWLAQMVDKMALIWKGACW